MSNLVNIDYVISVANQQGCAIWKITDMQGETLDKRNSATADLQKSLADLRDAWQQIQGDYINIKIAAKAMARGGDQQSTTFYYKVKCFAAAESSTAAADILPAVTGKMDPGIYSLLSDLKVQIAEQKKDVEIRELKRKLEDKGKGDGKSRILEQYLTKLLLQEEKAPAAIAAPIAGHTVTPAAAADPNGKARLIAALNKIKGIDPAYLETLEKLAAFGEKDPAAFDMYKKML